MSALDQVFSKPEITLEYSDDLEAINRLYQDRGWSDGLPIIPPTTERVERMLQHCDRPHDDVVLKIPPRYARATPLRIAANAVMAGCRPEHFPLVIAALEAMADPALNLYGVQATTHPCSTIVLFNGPLAREAGINAGHNAFGPGFPANATIGRAVRLSLFNIGGATPGTGDMATVGTPAKFTYCAAENEAGNPWEPYHVELGFPADVSTVTVLGAEGPHNINDHESTTAEGILKTIAGTIAMVGSNNAHHPSTPIIALGPEHAATIAGEGLKKSDVKQYVYDHGRLPLSAFSRENAERRLMRRFPERYTDIATDTVPMAHAPEDFIIMVIGGAGKHSAYIPTFGGTRAATIPIRRRDGSFAKSLADFRSSE
jgi:hypothetical protein